MTLAEFDDVALHYCDEGNPKGAPIVLAHPIGTSLAIWDPLLPLLPQGVRVIRYDARGHGRSSGADGPWTMGGLIRDTERLLDHLCLSRTMFVGLSLGGMVAQGLAVKRPDLIGSLVLCNTAAKIATPAFWEARIAIARRPEGMEELSRKTMANWFTREFIANGKHRPWQDLMRLTDPEAYAGAASAVAGTDFFTPTSGLRLPTLGISGSDDREIPPDLMRETLALIPKSEFRLIRKSGHLSPVDQPGAFAQALRDFLRVSGHVKPA